MTETARPSPNAGEITELVGRLRVMSGSLPEDHQNDLQPVAEPGNTEQVLSVRARLLLDSADALERLEAEKDQPKRIEVDIGAALQALQASPELGQMLNEAVLGKTAADELDSANARIATLEAQLAEARAERNKACEERDRVADKYDSEDARVAAEISALEARAQAAEAQLAEAQTNYQMAHQRAADNLRLANAAEAQRDAAVAREPAVDQAITAIVEWDRIWQAVCNAADPDDDTAPLPWEAVKAQFPEDIASDMTADIWSDYMRALLVYYANDLGRAIRSRSNGDTGG